MDQTSAPPTSAAEPSAGMRVLGWIGIVGMILVLYPYVFSLLVAPIWVYAIVMPLWLVLFWVALKNRRRRPLLTFLMPFITFVAWMGVISLGEVALGWTA